MRSRIVVGGLMDRKSNKREGVQRYLFNINGFRINPYQKYTSVRTPSRKVLWRYALMTHRYV